MFAILPISQTEDEWTHHLGLLHDKDIFVVWVSDSASNHRILLTESDVKIFCDAMMIYGYAHIDDPSICNTWGWCPISASLSIKQDGDTFSLREEGVFSSTEIKFEGFEQTYELFSHLLDLDGLFDGKNLGLDRQQFLSKIGVYVCCAYFDESEYDGRVRPPTCLDPFDWNHFAEFQYHKEAMEILADDSHKLRKLLRVLLEWYVAGSDELTDHELANLLFELSYPVYYSGNDRSTILSYELLCTISRDFDLK